MLTRRSIPMRKDNNSFSDTPLPPGGKIPQMNEVVFGILCLHRRREANPLAVEIKTIGLFVGEKTLTVRNRRAVDGLDVVFRIMSIARKSNSLRPALNAFQAPFK